MIDMQDVGNFGFTKKFNGSEINTSHHKKTGCKITHIRRWKPKPRSHVKTIGSVLSKRKASELSSNGVRSKCLRKKPFRRRASQKVNDTSSSEKPLSSMFRSVKYLNKYHRLKNTTDMDVGTQKTRRRRKHKKRKNEELDETARLQRRTRYLLIKMKLEQNLIDAYSGEGWNGQSREKIKPEKELQRAKKQILKCKLGIRDAIHQLETLSSEGCIEDSVLGPGGSVSHEHIFCSKCKLRDAFPDNDIILCDGTCNCAFHQKCLEPPLATENIPPGEQGWYCKFCECKIEILEAIDAHLGTRFSPNSKWQDIFLEAANAHDFEDNSLYPNGDWPSDDSGDVDYDPGRNERSCSYGEMGSEESVSGDASSSGSLYWTSEEDHLLSGRIGADGIQDNEFYGGRSKLQSSDKIVGDTDSIDSSTEYTRRQRRDVDYKKLHDEMFGKDLLESEEISEDEDWGPSRRKRRRNEADVAGTEKGVSDTASIKNEKKFRSNPEAKRKLFRIPPDAVKQLREVFAEDELPSRVVRENLSKRLGIALEKINKWFKNARYAALKIRKDLQEERAKHSIDSTGITKLSSTRTGKIQSADIVASSDNPRSVPSTTKSINLRQVRRRQNSKLTIIPSRKTKKRSAGAPSPNVNEVSGWLSKSVSLKSQMGSLKSKAILEKRVKSTCSGDTAKPYMVELEKIFCLEERLQKMKKILLNIHNHRNHTDKKEPSVVYVPVAELREKSDPFIGG